MSDTSRLLFVDFNGVLSCDPYWKSLRDVSHPLHRFAETVERFVFTEQPELFRQWMLGQHTAETFHALVAQGTGVPYQDLFESFVQDCAAMDVSENLIEKLRGMKRGFRIILATANTDALERYIIPHNTSAFDVFDVVDNSFHIGRLKHTDGGAYFTDRAAREGISLHRAYLLEDSERTCDVFRALGGTAFLVKDEAAALRALDAIAQGDV